MKNIKQVCAESETQAPRSHFFRRLFRGSPCESMLADAVPSGDESAHYEESNSDEPAAPKILVVDDDPVILKTVGIKLSMAGFDVITGHDGAEAISTARTEHPDVIILDVCFPPDVAHGGNVAWDGLGVMQWLHRMENGETPPIIMITGLTNEQVREKALASGAQAFFQKPIDSDGLVEAIRKALEVQKSTKPPTKKPVDFSI
jgi:DNA-binding response OmpR family regulator